MSLYLNDPLLTYLRDKLFITYFISWSPTLVSVKLLLFEQPDSDLDSQFLKTGERDLLLLSEIFSLSETKTESDDLVVLLKKWLLFKDCTKFFMIIPLPEFVK